MPGRIAPAVPNRRIVRTPASASSWKSRIAPGPPTPCEATTTGSALPTPAEHTVFAVVRRPPRTVEQRGDGRGARRVADTTACGRQAGAGYPGDGQQVLRHEATPVVRPVRRRRCAVLSDGSSKVPCTPKIVRSRKRRTSKHRPADRPGRGGHAEGRPPRGSRPSSHVDPGVLTSCRAGPGPWRARRPWPGRGSSASCGGAARRPPSRPTRGRGRRRPAPRSPGRPGGRARPSSGFSLAIRAMSKASEP